MSIQRVEATIKGLAPGILQHAFLLTPIPAFEKKSVEFQAEAVTHRDPETKMLCVPANAIYRGMCNAAAFSKGKGRSSLKKLMTACLAVTPEYISLGTKDYVISTQAVVNPPTKGRIARHRPHIKEWEASFTLEFDDELLKETEMHTCLANLGKLVGLLDFRPEKSGPYGRFIITSWKPIKEEKEKAA